MCSDNEEFRDPDVVRSEIFVVYFFVLCNFAYWSARSPLTLVLFTLFVFGSTKCDCCVKFVIICICFF